jgi:hypothetical protein
VSGVVAVLCAALLVLFTDIEVGLVRWVSCGPLNAGAERNSELCR